MSFGQELKDFVNGFQAGYKLVKSPEEKAQEKADLEYKQAQTAHAKASTGAIGTRQSLAERRFKYGMSKDEQARADRLEAKGYNRQRDAIDDRYSRAIQDEQLFTSAAARAEREAITTGATADVEPIDYDALPGATPLGETSPTIPASAIPSDGATIDDVSGSGGGDLPGDPADDDFTNENSAHTAAIASAKPAVRDALNSLVSEPGMDAALGSPDEAVQRGYLSGKGSTTQAMAREVAKKIDPEGRLSVAERNFATMGHIANYFNSIGQPERALEANKQMAQTYRGMALKYASIAKAMVEGGDLDGAAKAAVRTYANVLDGNEMDIKKTKGGSFAITITDIETGKVRSKEIHPPKEFAALIMELHPSMVDKAILRNAGEQVTSDAFDEAMANRGKRGFKPNYPGMSEKERTETRLIFAEDAKNKISISDNIKISEGVGDALTRTEEILVGSDPEAAKLFKDNAGYMERAAQSIMQQNSVTPEQATAAAFTVLHADPDQIKDGTPFTAEEGPEQGLVTVSLPGGQAPVVMGKNEYLRLYSIRQTQIAKLAAAAGKKQDRADRYDAIGNRIGDILRPTSAEEAEKTRQEQEGRYSRMQDARRRPYVAGGSPPAALDLGR